uniref:Uncharacterized protein n=1 Tax=Myotis myotis TaxID=51298 RepID=A0A7J7UD06_MYOMY|nr:hypothetical protein mMyoMyo1_008796 [Myotis myotis]
MLARSRRGMGSATEGLLCASPLGCQQVFLGPPLLQKGPGPREHDACATGRLSPSDSLPWSLSQSPTWASQQALLPGFSGTSAELAHTLTVWRANLSKRFQRQPTEARRNPCWIVPESHGHAERTCATASVEEVHTGE